ncbi:oxidoreductase [Cryobacterium zongtaii]|uniref:Oxidoreductase n=1 Tax=Cryobacterium zongtaii TaxID=1259217 RepID=A0A2S3ZBV7_9MICO|nr:SDR family NAD(P)-dependent oxidoreductase [Cryobacterium zongtaii]POH63348.1 oxidoreductase [Cryobacterium zongtaii]
MQLDNKSVIVTGGASGIGGAITRTFVQRGANVVVVDLAREAGEALAAELGDTVVFLQGDVSDPAVADRAVGAAVERFGGVHGLVNNAHASRQAPFLELTEQMWDLSFSTGLRATINFMRAAYPELKKTTGSVVNFGSGAGLDGQPTQAAYAAAKEAIRGLSRVVSNEWAPDGIRVNVVCPMAMTEGVQAWSQAFPELYQSTLAKIPLGRFGDPGTDVAPAVAFLVSDDSSYITGQTLMVDGGAIKLH